MKTRNCAKWHYDTWILNHTLHMILLIKKLSTKSWAALLAWASRNRLEVSGSTSSKVTWYTRLGDAMCIYEIVSPLHGVGIPMLFDKKYIYIYQPRILRGKNPSPKPIQKDPESTKSRDFTLQHLKLCKFKGLVELSRIYQTHGVKGGRRWTSIIKPP